MMRTVCSTVMAEPTALRYTKGRVMSCTTGARTTLFYTVEAGGVVPVKSFSTRHDLQEIEKFAQE